VSILATCIKQQTLKMKIKLLAKKIRACQAIIILGDKIASVARDWIRKLMGTCILRIRKDSKPKLPEIF